jgi:hypothetical protein
VPSNHHSIPFVPRNQRKKYKLPISTDLHQEITEKVQDLLTAGGSTSSAAAGGRLTAEFDQFLSLFGRFLATRRQFHHEHELSAMEHGRRQQHNDSQVHSSDETYKISAQKVVGHVGPFSHI